ncbi:MAG: 2-C-methyl-D-erythritol 4-phosphate cytidylyltransferase, partial [Halothiobacillaceae bacterium]
ALQGALAAGVAVTDEAAAMEWAGYAPRMVEGSPDNIKITVPHDLRLAELFLKLQHEKLL